MSGNFSTRRALVVSLLMVLVLGFTISVEGKDLIFESNLKKLEGVVTSEDLDSFLVADKKYLENLKDTEKIAKEVSELEKRLKNVDNEFNSVRDVKIYKGNTGLKNDGLRKAILSRKRILKEGKFQYDLNTFHTIDRGFAAERTKGKKFSQKEMDITYKAIADTLENIELDTSFLKDTKFVVSPYVLEGINGYAVTRSNDKNTVVVGIHLKEFTEDKLAHAVKSTTLHEIGHIFHHIYDEKLSKSSYLIETDKILSSSTKGNPWQRSVDENFAEDFRVHFSTRLGESSITPYKKKTVMAYNENTFKKVVDEINRLNLEKLAKESK